MTQHDFNAIFEHYPELIAEMPDVFTSHQFILHLAQRHQSLYIEALYAYRNVPNPQHATPFKTVHGILAKQLNDSPNLVRYVRHLSSTDIFKQDETCAEWQKV